MEYVWYDDTFWYDVWFYFFKFYCGTIVLDQQIIIIIKSNRSAESSSASNLRNLFNCAGMILQILSNI